MNAYGRLLNQELLHPADVGGQTVFDETIRALRSLEGTREITIPSGVVADAEGYIDRQCPMNLANSFSRS
jgi:hypothetical protein